MVGNRGQTACAARLAIICTMAILGPLNPAQLASAARSALQSAIRRLRPDHRSIAGGTIVFPSSAMRRFYLLAAVAPSRSAPRAYDDQQVQRAGAFAADAFPGVFATVPSSANRETTVFSVAGQDGAAERVLHVHRTGLVELLWSLGPQRGSGDEDELLLDAEEIATVVVHLARALARRPYGELSRAGRGRRRFARVDWWFNLAAEIDTPEGRRAWTGLTFPAGSPPRAGQRYPSSPADGYGSEALRGRRRGAPSRAVQALVGEVLATNGYYDFTAALDQTVEQALAGTELPDPQPMSFFREAEPSVDQRRVLDSVHEHVRLHGRCPTFRELDKQLDLEGLALRQLAESMPPGLLLPVVTGRGGMFRDEDEFMVTREGLRYCEHGREALDLLARALAYLAKREKPFMSTAERPQLQVTSGEIAKALRLSGVEVALVRVMLGEYEWQTWTSISGDPGSSWSMLLTSECVRRFRGVRDGDQYLRAREGESFAHQLEAEEALPRFALIGENPPSIELNGEPIVLRVENEGPTETFEATVVDVTNAPNARTPWHVRWRGEAEPRKEILGAGHWVLEIARDALPGVSDGNPTPGFVFLQPNEQEMFVAQTGPSGVGARYGLALRTRIRVTPLSQPQRSLDTVVTLHITERGLNILWDRHRVTSD